MVPKHLTTGLRIVIDIPPLPLLANDFVGGRGNNQESNCSKSNGNDSDKGDSATSSILSSPKYSGSENFDPSEAFGQDNLNSDSSSRSSDRSSGPIPEDISVYDSVGDPVPFHPPISPPLRRSDRLAGQRGPVIFHRIKRTRRNGERIKFPLLRTNCNPAQWNRRCKPRRLPRE